MSHRRSEFRPSFDIQSASASLGIEVRAPVYVSGETYLAAHRGEEAMAEFQKIIDHRWIVLNSPIAALSHLGVARACVLQGDTRGAKTAYQTLLTLWKNVDPDLPVLKQVKAKMHQML